MWVSFNSLMKVSAHVWEGCEVEGNGVCVQGGQ
jgi:hypothetical protein